MCEIKLFCIYSKFFWRENLVEFAHSFSLQDLRQKIQNDFPPTVKWIASCAKFSKK